MLQDCHCQRWLWRKSKPRLLLQRPQNNPQTVWPSVWFPHSRKEEDSVMRPIKECPACGVVTNMTSHHIMPVRHYGRKSNNHIILLCRSCHTHLERYIPQAPMPRDFYNAIVVVFLEHLCLKAKRKAISNFFEGDSPWEQSATPASAT